MSRTISFRRVEEGKPYVLTNYGKHGEDSYIGIGRLGVIKALKQMMNDNYGYYRWEFGIDPKADEKIAEAEARIDPLREAHAAAEAELETTLEKLRAAGLDESLAEEKRTEVESAKRAVKKALREVASQKRRAQVSEILEVAKRDETDVNEKIPTWSSDDEITYGEWIVRFMESRMDHEYERWELLEVDIFE